MTKMPSMKFVKGKKLSFWFILNLKPKKKEKKKGRQRGRLQNIWDEWRRSEPTIHKMPKYYLNHTMNFSNILGVCQESLASGFTKDDH